MTKALETYEKIAKKIEERNPVTCIEGLYNAMKDNSLEVINVGYSLAIDKSYTGKHPGKSKFPALKLSAKEIKKICEGIIERVKDLNTLFYLNAKDADIKNEGIKYRYKAASQDYYLFSGCSELADTIVRGCEACLNLDKNQKEAISELKSLVRNIDANEEHMDINNPIMHNSLLRAINLIEIYIKNKKEKKKK